MMCVIEVTPVLATERLVLRGPTAGDAAPLAELARDLESAGRAGAMPYPFPHGGGVAAVARAASLDWGCEAEFAIEHRNFGLVGMLGLKVRDDARPELGCWVGRPYWNRGYATEAVRAALKWVKRDWRKRLVMASHLAADPASGQVLCKAGFLYTGEVETRRARGRPVATRTMVWLA